MLLAAEESGQSVEDFINDHVTDATKREFLGRTVEAATVARSEWKIRLLARAFVRGAKDADLVDETEMFIKTVRDFEPAHARVLTASYQRLRDKTLRDHERAEHTVESLHKDDPGIGPAAALLWRELRDRDLVQEVTRERSSEAHRFRLTDLGIAVADWLRDLGDKEFDDTYSQEPAS